MQTEDMASEGKSGSKLLKALGFAAFVGIALAVGRIVLRVFREKPDAGEPTDGV